MFTTYFQGHKTCQGFPGSLGHLETDAKTFAEWGVDYVKMDGCQASQRDRDTGYPEFGRFLNQTNRPIVYSCSWPYYQRRELYFIFKLLTVVLFRPEL